MVTGKRLTHLLRSIYWRKVTLMPEYCSHQLYNHEGKKVDDFEDPGSFSHLRVLFKNDLKLNLIKQNLGKVVDTSSEHCHIFTHNDYGFFEVIIT